MIALTFLLALGTTGVTPPVFRAPRRPLVSIADYPASAKGARGTTHVALDVDATGRPTACRILASSGTAALDAATCRILRSRARFDPARDARGGAVSSSVETSITWNPPAL